MLHRNNGRNESEILQNKFTAYLESAVRRKRKDYLAKIYTGKKYENILADVMNDRKEGETEDLMANLPVMNQIENPYLYDAIQGLGEREKSILFAHVLEGQNFEELAATYGMSYGGITTAYYRIIKKLKKGMGESDI